MIRVSFGIYNTEAEVDEFIETLKKAKELANEAYLADPVHEDISPAY